MGKRPRENADGSAKAPKAQKSASKAIHVEEKAVDPTLALLFASSAGPVKAPPKSRYDEPPPARKPVEEEAEEDSDEEMGEDGEGDDEELSSVDGDLDDAEIDVSESEDNAAQPDVVDLLEGTNADKQPRKRKRNGGEDDLEGRYMQKLAKEEEKEEEERQAERRLKRQRLAAEKGEDVPMDDEDNEQSADDDEAFEDVDDDDDDEEDKSKAAFPSDVPKHESLAASKDDIELEKATRTVFLANVSTLAITSKTAKKTLLEHMGSFLESIPAPKDGAPEHKVESIRFRSTAYAGTSLPKKAAFAKKELMAATTKSTNAYVVYSTAFAAREAVKKLNATIVLDRHLRVDGVAHPAKTDHRRCVFVGNLGFVDDESMMDEGAEGSRKRSKIPSDIEEGLWRQFGKAGKVESVRVVRDEKTRVGKGFAYVQFEDANGVEAALLFNEKKYPPMLPRILRVVRAKAIKKTALASQQKAPARPTFSKDAKNANNTPIYKPKMTGQQQSLQGRAAKLLGKAGAAQFKKREEGEKRQSKAHEPRKTGLEGIARTPESFVFEGYRASAKSGKPKDLKLGKSGGGGKKKGKPRTRSSARASTWKKGGGKKD